MALFALIATDHPNSLDKRMAARPEHLVWLKDLTQKGIVKAAGPLLDEDDKPNGSLVIFEGATKSEIEQLAAQDPYAKAGLFEKVELRAWNWLIGNPNN